MELTFRQIDQNDNVVLADLIRKVFREFGIDQPGTVYTDPTTDHLFELFSTPNSIYWVAEEYGKIIGGCGIYPTDGLPSGCAELVKLYLLPESRGKGIGLALMQKSIASAIDFGFKQIYLESLPELSKAVNMYEKAGFRHISEPLGNSGHFACNIRMLLDLQNN